MIAIFLAALAGTASAASLDLPKWVIVPEDATNFSDVTLFCGLDAYDASTNTTPCYYQGSVVNATITFNTTSNYPKLVSGKILNAFKFSGNTGEAVSVDSFSVQEMTKMTVVAWVYLDSAPNTRRAIIQHGANIWAVYAYSNGWGLVYKNDTAGLEKKYSVSVTWQVGRWYMLGMVFDSGTIEFYMDGELVSTQTAEDTHIPAYAGQLSIGSYWKGLEASLPGKIDEVRFYENVALSPDEIKLLYLAGRKKLSEPANFRQIFSPLMDLTRDRATFYAGLEVSTSDPSGYVPVPESAVNMSITSAEKLQSDYTNAPFYYQGHYWYRADKIQFNLPIQFETVRTNGDFDDVIILDEDQKTYVYEREFKVTNPTAAKLNIVYSLDPTELGFSVLQYPEFELDGVRMVSWRPDENSSELYLIRTDTLDPGEISTHWIKSIWTLGKEELNFPAKLEDFRNILDWQTAQKMAENAVKGKADTWVRVIKISSNADVSNVTIYVPLKDVEDVDDVVEAVALTGSRATLQVEELDDGTIAVKVPADAFVSGEAEIKVFYNKETSWWKSILDRIMGMVKMIKSFFGFGGG